MDKVQPLHSAKLHWVSYISAIWILPGFLSALLIITIPPIVLGITGIPFVFLLYKGYTSTIKTIRNNNTKIVLYSNRVTVIQSVLSKKTTDIYLDKIEGANIYQNALGRLLNYGTIEIDTGGVIKRFKISKAELFREKYIEVKSLNIKTHGK